VGLKTRITDYVKMVPCSKEEPLPPIPAEGSAMFAGIADVDGLPDDILSFTSLF
jgi:hypothetical protein